MTGWRRSTTVVGHPPEQADLAADVADDPPVTPLRLDVVADASGVSYEADPHPSPTVGVNWVRVPRRVRQVQVGVWCRPSDRERVGGTGWVASFVCGWWRGEEIWQPGSAIDARRGPEVFVLQFVPVSAALPQPAGGVMPLFTEALVHAPTAGHLSVLMGADQALSGDGVHPIELLVARVG